MAGHSKWANTKHRKARQDAKRAKIWTKVIRELTVAARLGGGSPEDNPRLRAAVVGALAVNMPRDTINNAIKRGSDSKDATQVDEVTYEGYGPGGIAFLIEVMTDNRNRAVAEVRHAFSKHNGNLGTDGSVSYMFQKRGILQFEPGTDEDSVMEIALEADAEDVEIDEDGSITVLTNFENYASVLDMFITKELPPQHNEIAMVADNTVNCDLEMTEKIQNLQETLEDLDDVQNVYTNGAFAVQES